jgi:hypothetical protein
MEGGFSSLQRERREGSNLYKGEMGRVFIFRYNGKEGRVLIFAEGRKGGFSSL